MEARRVYPGTGKQSLSVGILKPLSRNHTLPGNTFTPTLPANCVQRTPSLPSMCNNNDNRTLVY